MTEWPEIPNVTARQGRALLPRDPAVVVRALHTVLKAGEHGPAEHGHCLNSLLTLGIERPRAEGILGWLPSTHVMRWEGSTLHVAPMVDLPDLAARYAAWVATRRVHEAFADQVRAYARKVAVEATALVSAHQDRIHAGPTPWTNSTLPQVHEVTPPAHDALTERLRRILSALDGSFLERRRHVRMAMLALLAGQHCLLLGPPGTAKSMLARALCSAFKDANYFEYLLSRFTHPDELFGPVSIPGLKEEDYRRLTEGFLPSAHVAFLDEIFKANSAILNSLLTLVNERVFHHGRHRDTVPLIGLIGASNEPPDPDGGLDALHDRFLVRLTVPPLGGADAFLQVATGTVPLPNIDDADRLTRDDLIALRDRARQVRVPMAIQDALVRLWEQGQRQEWQISDRRWRQAVSLLKTAAAADGRDELISLDLLLLEPMLCPEPERAVEVRESLLDQLGEQSAPEHDLRAQWVLLAQDRVAPLEDAPCTPPPGRQQSWAARMPVRQTQTTLFLRHHERALRTLADDRQRVEDQATRHLFLDRLPARVLSTHIEASRELAGILKAAEAYRRMVSEPTAAAHALVDQLPVTVRRLYGNGGVVAMRIGDQEAVSLSLSGERETPPDRNTSVRLSQEVPTVTLSVRDFLDWVDGTYPTQSLLQTLPSYSVRNAQTALSQARKRLHATAVPAPPNLPSA